MVDKHRIQLELRVGRAPHEWGVDQIAEAPRDVRRGKIRTGGTFAQRRNGVPCSSTQSILSCHAEP
jgi:hypothetical protein